MRFLETLKHRVRDGEAGDVYAADEREHARASMRVHDLASAESTMRIGNVFNFALLILVPLMSAPELHSGIMTAAAICLAGGMIWNLGGRRLLSFVSPFVPLMVFNFILVVAFSRAVAIAFGLDPIQAVLATSTLITLASILLILSPFSHIGTGITGVGYWLTTAILHPDPRGAWAWLGIYAVGIGFSVLIRQMQTHRTRRETILEYRARQAELRATGIRFQRDLELAREIQDSMAPPAESYLPEFGMVRCLQKKYEKIAGDWMTMRRFDDGSLVLVVIDATGKGLQAALVIHAIQSLWATTLEDDSFDAQKWLKLVNHALARLGEKQKHSASAGIAVLKDQRITYWSAGHLPLFLLIGGERHRAQLKTLLPRGTILGIGSALTVSSQYLDLAPNFPVRIFLASDGVLEKGTLTQAHDVEAVYESVRADGDRGLERCPSQDDKTLIVVERNFKEVKGVA